MEPSFAYKLRNLRLERALTQARLAERVGIARRQISRLEREQRIPTESERDRLAAYFNCRLGWTDLAPAPGRSGFPPEFLKQNFGRAPEALRPDKEVAMYVRIKAAVEERAYLAAPAEAALSDKGFATFVRTARCDSVNEAEFWVFLQTRGGHFARTSLARLAWNGGRVYQRGSKVCMCGRLWPVLYVESPLPMIFFPQVWFRTQFGPRRVDALVAVAGGGWFALEVNGEWHSGKRDHLRPMELGLPVVKLLPEELSSDQLLEQIQARYECAREAMG